MSTDADADAPLTPAEIRLRRKQESEAAAKVVRAEVEAKKVAEQLKTARLRALRLEKEAADAALAAEVPAAKPKTRQKS